MKSFNQHINKDREKLDEELNKKVSIDEATMGDLLIGLGAAGGLLALKKGWDKWGKGSGLHQAVVNKFGTKAMKAGAADAAKEKRDKEIEIAKKTGDKKALNKLLTPDERAQAKLDAAKAKQDSKTTRADAAALKFDKDEDDIIIKQPDAIKYKKIAGKAPSGWKTDPDDPSGKNVIKKDEKPEEAFNPEGDMTITESNELQAIMALDDAGIKAEINRKGQVVIKKKDKKKAHRALEKSFKKGGWPTLKLEDVEIEEGSNKKAMKKVADDLEAMADKGGAEAPALFSIASNLRKGRLPTGLKVSKKVSAVFKKHGIREEVQKPRTAYEVVSEARNKIIETIDRAAADELYLWMQNERDLQRQKDSIIKNIIRKKKSDKYDHSRAPKLWMFWVDNGAKAYDKLNSSPGVKTFDKDTRWSVAIQFANEYNAEIDLGNYS